MQVIDSARNSAVRAYKECVARGIPGLVPLEGFRLVQDALYAGAALVTLYVAEEAIASAAGRRLRELGRERGANVIVISDDVAKRMADTRNPQGVFATAAWAPQEGASVLAEADKGEKPSFVVLLDGMSDPGNLGTIVRAAAALGAAGVVAGPGCAGFGNPKVVRASMGSIFRIPTAKAEELEGLVRQARTRGYEIIVSDVRKGISADELAWPRPDAMKAILAVGSEARGVSESVCRHATAWVKLDMSRDVESLNAASAASILMYILDRNAARWRRDGEGRSAQGPETRPSTVEQAAE